MEDHTEVLVKRFRDYKPDAANWITLSSGEYYPDILKDACILYGPVLALFGMMLAQAGSSVELFMAIQSQTPNQWMRIQLSRVFRKYPPGPFAASRQHGKARHRGLPGFQRSKPCR